MRHRTYAFFAALALLSAGALADDVWQPLAGDAARAALSGHTLAYANGATQSFSANGDTAYDSGHLQPGRWRIDAGKYCSLWPPSGAWACYRFEQSADGLSVRFTSDDGSATEGRFIEN